MAAVYNHKMQGIGQRKLNEQGITDRQLGQVARRTYSYSHFGFALRTNGNNAFSVKSILKFVCQLLFVKIEREITVK